MAPLLETLAVTLPEESLAAQAEQFAVAVKLLAKMGIIPEEQLTSLKSETSSPLHSVLIKPKNAGRDLGSLSLFAHEGDDRPMMYLLEPPVEGVEKNSSKYLIHGILHSYLKRRHPQFQITTNLEADLEGDLSAVKIAMTPGKYLQFEEIGAGDRVVGLIFYQPQELVTSSGQTLLVGNVGFLTLP